MTKEILLFNYNDYRSYLRDYLDFRRILEKGVQTKLAQEMGCQPAYVSKVLAMDAHFSLEQAERVSYFCNHTEIEKHFYLLITQHGRAASPQLKKYFAEQIQELHSKNKSLKEHMNLEVLTDLETQLYYYGSWMVAAIHVLLTIPDFQTRPAICAKLNLSIEDVNRVLDFLKSKGMAQEIAGVLKVGPVGLHLGNDSPVIKQHHQNWRLKAVDSIVRKNENDLHYSSVVSLADQDRERFRAELVQWIAHFRKDVASSKEEELAAICIDFFTF